MACRFDPERDRQVRLACPDWPGEDQILGSADPVAARERGDLRGGYTFGGLEVEAVERLDFWESRLAQALANHGLVPRGVLGRQHLVQVVLKGPVLLARLTRQGLEAAHEPGHLERARLRDNQIARDGGAAHCTPPVSHAS